MTTPEVSAKVRGIPNEIVAITHNVCGSDMKKNAASGQWECPCGVTITEQELEVGRPHAPTGTGSGDTPATEA